MINSARLGQLAIGAVATLIVAIGATLAVSERAMSDPKSAISTGDQVMAMMPDGDGYSWQGPFAVVDNDQERMILATDNGNTVTDSTQIMPLHVWHARTTTTDRGEH